MNDDKLQFEYTFEILKNRAYIKRIEIILTIITFVFEMLLGVFFAVLCNDSQQNISDNIADSRQVIEHTDLMVNNSSENIKIATRIDRTKEKDDISNNDKNENVNPEFYFYLRY